MFYPLFSLPLFLSFLIFFFVYFFFLSLILLEVLILVFFLIFTQHFGSIALHLAFIRRCFTNRFETIYLVLALSIQNVQKRESEKCAKCDWTSLTIISQVKGHCGAVFFFFFFVVIWFFLAFFSRFLFFFSWLSRLRLFIFR